jgi:benzodiazapine receptor
MSIDTTTPRSVAPFPGAPPLRRPHAGWRSMVILLAAVAATTTVALTGGVLIAVARDVWYDNLRQPGWAPPSWVFGSVASLVHLAVAIAGWRIWVKAPGSTALTLWVVQLGLGLGWTVLFFGLWVPRWALAESVVLAVVVAATIVASWPSSRLAAGLLVTYLAWIGVLMTLNAAIVTLN